MHSTASVGPVRRAVKPLVVGAADDRAEREADRLADEVITRLQDDTEVEPGAAHEHAGGVHRKAAASPGGAPEVGWEGGQLSDDLTHRIESARGGGTPLPGPVRSRLEQGFGTSLADVRIHTGAEAASLNRAVSARAFTTGSDIFFGTGEYAPDTPAGERVLAHEVAHVQQQSRGARRQTIRRWDIKASKIDWAKTKKISTIKSGQAVYFFDDAKGDRIVVKAEDSQVGMSELASVMHESLSGVKSVRHRPLGQGDRDAIMPMITDKSRTKLDKESWSKLGAEKRSVKWITDELGPGDHSDLDIAQHFHGSQLRALSGAALIAMTYAAGDKAEDVSQKADTANPMKPEKNRMRGLLMDWKHLENLGQLTAVDLFLNNGDRVLMGNVGNWIYDPHSAAITAIDHVDAHVPKIFQKGQTKADLESTLKLLKSGELGATAARAVRGLSTGLSDPKKGNDPDFVTWIDSEGGYRRQVMEEAIERGLKTGRSLLIKTFTATRFTIGGSKSRQVKKSIKKAAKDAYGIDEDNAAKDPHYYYKILKTRAEWLKKN